MSRIGLKPVEIPEGVKVNLNNQLVSVEGPKGKLEWLADRRLKISISENKLEVARSNDDGKTRAVHGTTRQLIDNMINGVTKGWQKTLEIQGTGFRAALSGQDLTLSLGFSHPVKVTAPVEITFSVVENKITVSGIDRSKVGQMAANLRAIKPPDPYRGKGIRYEGEQIKLKPGKQAKAGAVGGAKPGGK